MHLSLKSGRERETFNIDSDKEPISSIPQYINVCNK